MTMTPDEMTAAAPTPAAPTLVAPATPAAGRPPVAPPAAGYVGTLIALAILAIGAVALRDSALAAGWLTGSSWTSAAIGWIDGLTYQAWMLPAGIAIALVGLWSVLTAVRPRRRTGVAVPGATSIWIGPADLARLATAAVEAVPGVLTSKASANLRTISVKASVTADDDAAVKAAITTAVGEAVNGFTTTPLRIKVRTRSGEH